MRSRRLRSSLLALALLLGGVAGSTTEAGAQEGREVQVALDPDRGIFEIGPDLRRDLGLFPEVSGFLSARLFEAPDGSHVLEISARDEGSVVRERRRMGPAQLDELRGRIATALEARGMDRAVSREGRGGLVLAETVLGLAFYGWAVPVTFDIEDGRAALAAYLLTAGASFYIPYRLTRSRPVTQAHRDAAVWGGTRGIVYGLLIGDALTLGDDDDAFDPNQPHFEEDNDEQVIVGLGLATSIAGSVLGYHAVDPARHDRGDVALWSTGGDFALAYGFGTAVALGLYDGDEECFDDVCFEEDTESTTVGHLTTAGLGLAGMWAARRWAEAEDYTVGDARALLSFGLLGGQVMLPLAWGVFDDADGGEKGFAASLVAGSAAALWLGNRVLRRRSLSDSDGLLVQAGHLAGGALAGGLTYLFDDGQSDEVLYMTTTALGSVAGSVLTFNTVAADSPARPGEGGADRGATVEISPAGLWAPLLGRKDTARRVRVPLVTIRH